jgi:cell division GTPase FtsZ
MAENVTIKEVDNSPKQKTKEEIQEENKNFLSAISSAKKEEIMERKVDPEKLAALKAKMAEKEKEQEQSILSAPVDRSVSIKMGVVGIGQAGSRIAEEFSRLGYDAGVINTSAQDLAYINVPDQQKLLLEGSLGGTGKDLDLGRQIFEQSSEQLTSFVEAIAQGNDMLVLAISGGGGTGSSSVDTMIPLLFSMGMPLGVIYILPKATEDAQSKKNSIETLARLAKMTSSNVISSLVVVDNARIEQIYGGLSQSQFWTTANSAIVEPINIFNTLTSQPSQFTSLDPSDFGKIISCGDCSVYGVVEVEDYVEETALAEAVMKSLSSNMLAEGFDLSQTRTGGVIILGSQEALSKLPAINIDYCFSMISEATNGANIFQGIYAMDDMDSDSVKIYSWFAGLGLPQDRIENLKKESKAQASVMAEKEKMRANAMSLDLGEDKVSSVKDQIERKIKNKNSGFNKLQGTSARTSIIDKRRK